MLHRDLVPPTEADAQDIDTIRNGITEHMGDCEGYSRTMYLSAKLLRTIMGPLAAIQDPEFTMCQSPYKETEEYHQTLIDIGERG